MQSIAAEPKITTRMRPTSRQCEAPVPETITSHAALCPHCQRETRVGFGAEAAVYGGCAHLRAIEQRGSAVTASFAEGA